MRLSPDPLASQSQGSLVQTPTSNGYDRASIEFVASIRKL